MTDQDIRTRAHQIITEAVNCVFSTLDSEGYPHPRTMWTAGVDDDFTTYLLTHRDLLKIKQVQANSKVGLFWTESEDGTIGWNYTFLKGNAEVTDSQELRDRFWNDALTEYFPEGKEDPNYVVIVVKPKELMLMDSHTYPLQKVEF